MDTAQYRFLQGRHPGINKTHNTIMGVAYCRAFATRQGEVGLDPFDVVAMLTSTRIEAAMIAAELIHQERRVVWGVLLLPKWLRPVSYLRRAKSCTVPKGAASH
jgi:hypothetical protein